MSVDEDGLQHRMEKHSSRILETYVYRDMYNADETGLFFQLLPAKNVAAKMDKCVGEKTARIA